MITQLKKQLSIHFGSKEARRKIKEIRSTRKWPEFMNLAGQHSVTMAPSFIVFDDQDREVFRGSEVPEIEDFIKSL